MTVTGAHSFLSLAHAKKKLEDPKYKKNASMARSAIGAPIFLQEHDGGKADQLP